MIQKYRQLYSVRNIKGTFPTYTFIKVIFAIFAKRSNIRKSTFYRTHNNTTTSNLPKYFVRAIKSWQEFSTYNIWEERWGKLEKMAVYIFFW